MKDSTFELVSLSSFWADFFGNNDGYREFLGGKGKNCEMGKLSPVAESFYIGYLLAGNLSV